MAVFAANDTVLLFATNVPLFVQSPKTDRVLFPFIVNVSPVEMVIERQTAPPAFMIGSMGVPVGMITSVVEVGTAPLHQLEGVSQSLVIPSQVLPGPQG